MQNIKFYWGYMANNKIARFSYWLCKTFPFIPTLDVDLYIPNHFRVKHSIYVGVFGYYWRWYKINDKWRFENLTDK